MYTYNKIVSMERPVGFKDLFDQARAILDFEAGKQATRNVVKTIHDNAMPILLFAAKDGKACSLTFMTLDSSLLATSSLVRYWEMV